jgi:ATP-dependent helicase HrpA
MLALPEKVKYLKKSLPGWQQMCLHYAPLGLCDDLRDDLTQAAFDAVFMHDPVPRSSDEFHARLEEHKGAIIPQATRLAAIVAETLAEYQLLAGQLSGAVPPHRLAVVRDVRMQMEALIYPGFIAHTPALWLPHLPRYIRAARLRLEKYDRAPERDRQAAADVSRLWECLWTQLKAGRGLTQEQEEFRWQIEELRVSLFAQALKAAIPVSIQRLEKRWSEIGRC